MSQKQLESAYQGVHDRRMLEQLDEAWDIQCESQNHGHSPVHSGPAAFMQVGHCQRCIGFRCAAIVAAYKVYGIGPCPECGATEPKEIVPLEARHD